MEENLQLQLKVVTPKGSLLDEEAASFTACSEKLGEFCILPNHRPIMASIAAGRMIVEQQKGTKAVYALDRGFLEAGADHVNVITEQCIPVDELDQADLTKEVAELEEKLAAIDAGAPEAEEIVVALEWAKVRLTVTEKTD
ncbi:MAG: ATP synthase F1 subunit epsilon [Proteobacteria bacterium]|nr:ATP synthase F1 subunit epsilon [Pseudomonadota bacterium]